ncbi:MAG: type II 3-dehydroquinate dehydratase [Lentisphaerae bacterium]|jgi:3-dehydroquinate dehydratase-2|nr:type II 3-dehydroquinate dehydratase [Lentisphaerota bacterium]
MKQILLINGPNLALLGSREPGIYGVETLDQIVKAVSRHAEDAGFVIKHFQSDIEGELVRAIGESRHNCQGIIINPAAYTHTSVAIRDAISACGLPTVEVHLSNTYKREPFRHDSLTVPVCVGQIMGFGAYGYLLALEALINYLRKAAGE